MVRLNRFFAAMTTSGARQVLILLGCVALVIIVVLCWYVILIRCTGHTDDDFLCIRNGTAYLDLLKSTTCSAALVTLAFTTRRMP